MINSDSFISVQGHGYINVVPDVMRLDIGVSVSFNSYKEAYARGKENTEWVSKILDDNEQDPELAKIINFDLGEEIKTEQGTELKEHQGKREKRYRLEQKIRIDLPINLSLVSKIIRSVGEKLPGVSIDIGYTLYDIHQTQLHILENAVSDSGVKAKIMAEAAGCSLGRVAQINYQINSPGVYQHVRTIHNNEEAKASTPEALNIYPDDFTISDTVEVTWNLR